MLTSLFRKRAVWRHWWTAHCAVNIPCGVTSLVTSSLCRMYSVWCDFIGDKLIVPYVFRVVWLNWWPVHCAGYQALYESAIPKLIWSALVVHWICHHDHWIWPHYIAMCGIIWKLCYKHTSWTPDMKLLQWILNIARSINNCTVFCNCASCLVTWVNKCSWEYGGHFEQLALAVNYKCITVNLTTKFNKSTTHFFRVRFI